MLTGIIEPTDGTAVVQGYDVALEPVRGTFEILTTHRVKYVKIIGGIYDLYGVPMR